MARIRFKCIFPSYSNIRLADMEWQKIGSSNSRVIIIELEHIFRTGLVEKLQIMKNNLGKLSNPMLSKHLEMILSPKTL